MKRLFLAVLIAVVALMALGTIIAIAAPPSPGTAESFGAVQNTSTVAASVTIDYYDLTGAVKASRSVSVSPKATQGLAPRLLDGTPQQLPPGWVGSAIVSSDQEVVAVSYINFTGGSTALSPDGKTGADYGGVNAPNANIMFPNATNRDNEATSLVLQNAGTTAAKAYLNYYDRTGNFKRSTQTATIPASAQATVNVVTDMPVGTVGDFIGSVVVTSTQPLAGVAMGHWAVAGGSYGYDAEPVPTSTGGVKLYFPKATRRSTTNSTAVDCAANGGWYDYSGAVVQNTSPSASAAVTVTFYDRTGNQVTQFTDSIPKFSSHGYNTRYASDMPAANQDALKCNFLGSVVVESSSVPIVGILKQAFEADHWASAYNGVASTAAGTSLYYPFFYHTSNDYANPPTASNPWSQWSGAIVQNVDTVPVTVYINVLGRDGSLKVHVLDPNPIAPGNSHGYNSQYDGSLPSAIVAPPAALGWGFTGGAYITATGKIVGLESTWNMQAGDVNETLAFPK